MSTQVRHLKFLNDYTYFRAQARFNTEAQNAARVMLANPELAAIKARVPKEK